MATDPATGLPVSRILIALAKTNVYLYYPTVYRKVRVPVPRKLQVTTADWRADLHLPRLRGHCLHRRHHPVSRVRRVADQQHAHLRLEAPPGRLPHRGQPGSWSADPAACTPAGRPVPPPQGFCCICRSFENYFWADALARGSQTCSLFSSQGSAHCLRFDPLQYHAFEIGSAIVRAGRGGPRAVRSIP